MITLDTLRAEVARGMCNKASRNTCHCIGKIKCRLRAEEADAAIAIVLRAVAKECDLRTEGRPTAMTSEETDRADGHDDALQSLAFDIEEALAAGGGR